jgi:hypothetical protein
MAAKKKIKPPPKYFTNHDMIIMREAEVAVERAPGVMRAAKTRVKDLERDLAAAKRDLAAKIAAIPKAAREMKKLRVRYKRDYVVDLERFPIQHRVPAWLEDAYSKEKERHAIKTSVRATEVDVSKGVSSTGSARCGDGDCG